MRVIAGSAKGHRLRAPKGRMVRPTADRVREAIFSMLGRRVEDAKVLDLYAGAGTLAIEALSRGATSAVLVERSDRVAGSIRQNVEKCGFQGRASIVVGKVSTYVHETGQLSAPFDLIFLDPPYRIANTEVEETLKGLVEQGFLADGGSIVLERASSASPVGIASLVPKKSKIYGDTAITIFEKRAVGEG